MRRAPIIAALAVAFLLLFCGGTARADGTVVHRTNDAWQQLADLWSVGESASVTIIPAGAPTVAHLWMDTNGGSCVRQTTAGAYNDAQACDNLAEALTAANAGDTVLMLAGSSFTAAEGVTNGDGPGNSSSPVQVWSQTNVVVEDYDLSNETGIDFRSVSVVKGTPSSNDDKVIDLSENNHYISFYDCTLDVNWKITDGLGISGGNSNILWSGGWIKHAVNEKLIEVDTYNAPGQQTDITIENAELGDMGFSANTYPGGADPHGEIFWLQQTTRFVIRNTVLTGSISTGNMNWGGDGNNLDYTISNTVWGPSYSFAGGVDIAPGAAVAYRAPTASGVNIQGDNLNGYGTIEYSVFDGSMDLSGQTITYRGNIDRAIGCEGGITYHYNRHVGADCSTSDVQDSGAFSDFVSTGSGTGGWDFRPVTGATHIDAGDPASYPTTDLRGITRPLGAGPDQGPYEGV